MQLLQTLKMLSVIKISLILRLIQMLWLYNLKVSVVLIQYNFGDTLAVIAMKNGVNWRDVAKWNQIDPEKTLFVGTSLYLYDAKPQEVENTAKSAAKPDVYVVQANDSLTGVANQFNLSVKQLAEYNDLSVTDGLFVGQKLQLKEPKGNRAAKVEPKAIQASTRRITTKSYTVKRGEYLKLIADRYALSNQELADLTPGIISW